MNKFEEFINKVMGHVALIGKMSKAEAEKLVYSDEDMIYGFWNVGLDPDDAASLMIKYIGRDK